jgi:FtsZ-binding cell division protein ZapB
VAHSLGEVVGLGLRNLANCPVEMNLMPDSTLRWRAFNEKKPYFMATIFLLAMVAGAIGFLFQELATAKEKESDTLQPQVQAIQEKVHKMKTANDQLQNTQREVNQITAWMGERYYWGDVLTELRRTLIRSEDEIVKKYAAQYAALHPAQKQGMEAGIWIEQMMVGTAAPVAPTTPASGGTPATPSSPTDPNNTIMLVCRAVDLSGIDTSANNEIVYAVERELKNAPVFDPKTVQPSAQISPVDANGTFTFSITVSPQNPLKLQL